MCQHTFGFLHAPSMHIDALATSQWLDAVLWSGVTKRRTECARCLCVYVQYLGYPVDIQYSKVL